MKYKGYAKFWRANKVRYGRRASWCIELTSRTVKGNFIVLFDQSI